MDSASLFGLTLSEISAAIAAGGARSFTAQQLCTWLYRNRVFDYEQMSNLPKNIREWLAQTYPAFLTPWSQVSVSKDGTKKYLFEYSGGRVVETAVIPDGERLTVCVSSQAGCRYGCRFCATGMNGFHGQLSSGEILNQLMSIDEAAQITNIVYMGMGEPLDNLEAVLNSLEILTADWGFAFGAGRITVSTIGLTANLEQLLEKTRVNIAISLHSPFSEDRAKLMPVENSHPVKDALDTIRSHELPKHRRVSLEYIVFKGINHHKPHAVRLADLAMRCRAKVNLIPYNKVPGLPFESPDENEVIKFQQELLQRGVGTTIRRSRGRDIMAACGTLAGKKPATD